MKRRTVLITCAGGSGPIYLAKRLSRRFNVVMADADERNAGALLGFPFHRIPFGNDPVFKPALKSIIRRHAISIVIPGADEELLAVCDLAMENPDITVILPTPDFIRLCLDKKALMAALHEARISTLLPFGSPRSVRYPAIAKPNQGRGSRGVHRIDGARQLEGYLKLYGKKFSEVLVQPLAGGDEYTVSVIVNDLNRIIGIVPKRIIVKKGITRAAVTERNRVIESACRRIVDHFRPCGPFNVQLKLHKGKVSIFEINPRLSTTSVLTEKAFGNEVDLFLKFSGRKAVPAGKKVKAPVYLYRYEENVFR